jgi:hypothetical protein
MADEPSVPESIRATEDATTSAEPDGSAAAAPDLPPAAPAVPDTGYTLSGVPTLEGVRDKIETRLGNAMGATELAQETPEVRTATERYEARQKAAAEKLEQIRASMHKPD